MNYRISNQLIFKESFSILHRKILVTSYDDLVL